MSSIFFGFFPAAERVLVGLILERAQVSPTDAKFSKVIFSGPQLPEQVREMVTFVHGGLSRTYAAPEQGGWSKRPSAMRHGVTWRTLCRHFATEPADLE